MGLIAPPAMTGATRLDRLKAVLACPGCGGDLEYGEHQARCRGCGAAFPIRGCKIAFTEVPRREDSLDDLKGKLKRWLGPLYYSVGIDVIAPTYPINFRKLVRRYLDPRRQLVVDVGCGNRRLDPDVIGIDLFDYDAVDVVCDLTALPFKPGSVDAFVSRSVLEHVRDPAAAVRHLLRCTRPGGLGVHLIPFLFPFHASPHDYQRYTHKGHEVLFAGYELVEQRNATGPVTLFLLMTIELLSVLFSFGLPRLKALSYLLFCGLLFPLKYLDVVFVNRRCFLTMAPTIVSVLRKPG
jgi:SAM-dependent methyltransferase